MAWKDLNVIQWINIFMNYQQQLLMRRYTNQDKGASKDTHTPKAHDQPANTSSKITLHFPAQVQHYQEDDNTNPVTIYLRSPSKKSFKFEVPSKVAIADIKQMAEQRTGIRKDKQMLHLNGKNVTQYSYIRLQSHNIIHITNCDDLLNPEELISLKVKIIDSYRKNIVQNKKYNIRTDISVNQLLDQIMMEREEKFGKPEQKQFIYFLESSRLLDKEKSFYEQDISKNTEIICLITQNELKTRFSNDTKEEILHDISQLLGFQEQPVERQPPKVEKHNRPRYPRQERKQDQPKDRFKTAQNKRVYQIPDESQQFEDGTNLNKTVSTPELGPDFKKKKQQSLSKTFSATELLDRPLITKIKATKSRKEIQLLLSSQEQQTKIFELPDTIPQMSKEDSKQQEVPSKQEEQKEMEIVKPSPSIPKVMPVQERRKIRLEIEKLFDLSDNSEGATGIKEEEKPKSPPTEQPLPRQEKGRQKMRLSMGSRPAFLQLLRMPKSSPVQSQ